MSDSLEDYPVKGCPPTNVPQSQLKPEILGHYRNRQVAQRKGDEKIRYRGGGCFSGDTEITTPFGSQKIAELDNSDLVHSINRRTGKPEPQEILCVKKYENSEIWSIQLEDNVTIKTTATHSFRINNHWLKARNITSDDSIELINKTGKTVIKKVFDSRPDQSQETVFNLIINKNFNYIANGALVHSFTYFREIRSLMWSIQIQKNTRDSATNLHASTPSLKRTTLRALNCFIGG